MSSITTIAEQLEYSESDGQPMGETDRHRRWMNRIFDLLSHHLRDQRVYIGSSLLVYYMAGQPARFVVPDIFVVLDCGPAERRIFKTWEERRIPNVVIEVTSRSTSHEDLVKKPAIYEQMGVQEYFLFDPTVSYLAPALQGFRLENGQLTRIEPHEEGVLTCDTLGLDLKLSHKSLLLIDRLTGRTLLAEAEENWQTAETERHARIAAESRVRELEALLKKLLPDGPDSPEDRSKNS